MLLIQFLTNQVALLAGLISHSDGLVDSAISCLQSVDLINGWFFNLLW